MGKLYVIDGLDGSGKHTQLTRLAAYLRQKGKKVRCLAFPCYRTPGAALVEEYLAGHLGGLPSDTGAYAASLFYAMDRYYSYCTDWRREAEDPETILLADRYTTANAVHQTGKLPREEWDSFLDWLYDTEYGKLGLPRPHQVIYLELLPALSLALVEKRSVSDGRVQDIHEKDASFFEKSYETALYAAEKCGWEKIRCFRERTDGADGPTLLRTEEEIFSEILTRTGL